MTICQFCGREHPLVEIRVELLPPPAFPLTASSSVESYVLTLCEFCWRSWNVLTMHRG